MKLSKSVGDQIVAKLSKVVEQNINIIDTNGLIISSTDPKRIGSVHYGAVKMIKEELRELVIESDDQYPGSKAGINLTIEFNNNVIGFIGLTGKTELVRKYGEIIKKMTEILILDAFLVEQKSVEKMAINRFLEEWVFGKYEANHPQEFRYRAESLGINIDAPRRIMVISLKSLDKKLVSEQMHLSFQDKLSALIRNQNQQYFFRTATLYICVLNKLQDSEILTLAQTIIRTIESQEKCKVFIGIDSYDNKPIRSALKNANIALQISLNSKKNINIYSFVNLDFAIGTMIEKNKEAFLNEFFNQLPTAEISDNIELLRVYYECEGSIHEASEKLFIHKNTLQYRLNKIYEMTGYDPRKISSSYLFIMAIKLFDLIAISEK